MKKNSFITLKVKSDTAVDFRKFSQQMRKQQTETLQLMLDFFKKHNLSPCEDLGPNMKTLEGNINRRINALIAIIKDIEKTQTKPVLAMIQLLFQEDTNQKKTILVEKISVSQKEREMNPSAEQELLLKNKLSETRTDLKILLERVMIVRNNFGSPYLRLNLNQEEYQSLQIKYKYLK